MSIKSAWEKVKPEWIGGVIGFILGYHYTVLWWVLFWVFADGLGVLDTALESYFELYHHPASLIILINIIPAIVGAYLGSAWFKTEKEQRFAMIAKTVGILLIVGFGLLLSFGIFLFAGLGDIA